MAEEDRDLSFLEELWPDTLTDEDMESETNPGLRLPRTGVTTRKQNVNTAGGQVEATLQTWEEVGFIKRVGVKAGREDGPYSDLKPVSVWFTVQVAEDASFGNTNTGRYLDTDFLRFYPVLLTIPQDKLDEMVEAAPENSPRRKWRARKFDTTRACRKMATILKATGHSDRLTAGASGYQAFRGLHTIADLLANRGEAFQGVPVKVTIRRGMPDWGGSVADHEIVDYAPLDGPAAPSRR